MGEFLVTSLEELIIETRIGISDEERNTPQKVKISFKLKQNNLNSFEDDEFQGYNCYAKISKEIKKYCSVRSFKLIEYLCLQLYKIIKDNVSFDTSVYVSVEKYDIRYEDMKFNAKAEYSDL